METILRKRFTLVIALALCAVAGPALAQFKIRAGFGAAPVVEGGEVEGKAGGSGKFASGPSLKTDPEAQQLLARAEQFIIDERYDLAAVLWQKVLDDAGDNLVSIDTDDGFYISLRRQVEQRISKLSRLALATYRVTADGEAQALINAAGPEKEEEALSQVVRRFFMSSVGDDAAYKLGCLSLDRHDFIGASRMFAKILDEHPDPSMSRSDVLLRLTVAASRVGDRDGANKLLSAIESATGPRPTRALLAEVADDIAKNAASPQFISARLAMPQLPADATSKTLTELWSREFAMTFPEQATNRNMQYMDGSGRPTTEKRTVPRSQVIDRWKQHGWMSAGKLLFHEGRVYFKTHERMENASGREAMRVECWNTLNQEKVVWKGTWYNEFELDEFSQQMGMMAIAYGMQPGMGTDNRPRTQAEVMLFGDRIQQDMSIVGTNLYSIEGRQVSGLSSAAGVRAPKPFNYQNTARRSRVNYLAAFDARTGKAKWHRAADDEAKEGTDGGLGFMAAPVGCGTVLLTPMTDGGAMWLYGLSPDDGRTLWKTYLCDEPEGGCNPWSPIAVAVEGRDAYVLCGAGVVFAVDGTSGAIRWVVRYVRDEKPGGGARVGRNMYGFANRSKDYDGWEEDKLIIAGRQLVVMASDSNQLLCLDSRTGEKLWDSKRRHETGAEVSYCVGISGRRLCVAGKSQVRGYDIISGKIKWEYPKSIADKQDLPVESFGRGVLTDDAIYIPVKDSVLKLDPDGHFVSQVGVRLSIPGEDPVGNLYSDGEKLWMLSANRVFALTHIEYRMQVLEKRIKAGDPLALIDRFRLYSRDENWPLAMDDLKAAFALMSTQKGPEEAASAVFGSIDELKLATTQPKVLLETLTQLFGAKELKPEHRVKLESLLSTSLSSLPREKTPGVAATVLAAAPLLKQEFLVTLAARVMKAVSTADDKAALAAAVNANQLPANVISAEAWAILDPEAARPVLRTWLTTPDAKLKLLTTRALLQTGDREAIGSLIEMLENADLLMRNRAYQSLRSATAKNDLPFVAYVSEEERGKQVQAWKDWYAANKDTVKIVSPLPEAGTQLGRTLICLHSRNQIVELDATGKEIGRKSSIIQPWSALGLPNGNRLVASPNPNQPRVVEYDDQWKEVWVVDGLPAGAWSVDRSLEGVTVIACADAAQVIEVKPGAGKEKKVLWSSNQGGRPVFVKRLETGNTLICLHNLNKVIEIDGGGKQVWESPNFVNPYCAQRLENGNTLITAMVNGNNGMIVEVDPAGKTVKTHKQGIRTLYAAQKLENGNIMYIDNAGLHEIDPDGKPGTFDRREAGVTGFSRF